MQVNSDLLQDTPSQSAASPSSSANWNGREVARLSPEDLKNLWDLFMNSPRIKIGDGNQTNQTKVYRTTYHGRDYAVKITQFSYFFKELWLEREVVIGSLLRHPNIVAYHGRGVHQNVVIMDYVGNEDLNDLCQMFHFCLEEDLAPEEQARRWGNTQALMAQVRTALAYLHENHYIYRDLKGENIRVEFDDENKLRKAVLIDLGSVRHTGTDDGLPPKENSITQRERRYSIKGNMVSISPEVLKGDGHYTEKADCWSLGALFYYLLMGNYPFEGRSSVEISEKIKTEAVKLPEWMPASARDLISKLLDRNPETRPSLQEIEKHAFFTENYGDNK